MKLSLIFTFITFLLVSCVNRRADVVVISGQDITRVSCFTNENPTILRTSPASGSIEIGTEVRWQITLPTACSGDFEVSVNSGNFIPMGGQHTIIRQYAESGTKTITALIRPLVPFNSGPAQASVTDTISVAAAPVPLACTIRTDINPPSVIQNQSFPVFVDITGSATQMKVNGQALPSVPLNPQSFMIDSTVVGANKTLTVTISNGDETDVACTNSPFAYSITAPPVAPTCALSVSQNSIELGSTLRVTAEIEENDGDVVAVQINGGTPIPYTNTDILLDITPSEIGPHAVTASFQIAGGSILACNPAAIDYQVVPKPPVVCTSLSMSKNEFTPGEIFQAELRYTGTIRSGGVQVTTNGATQTLNPTNSPMTLTFTAPSTPGSYAIATLLKQLGGTDHDECPNLNYTVVPDCQRLFVSSENYAGTNRGREYYTNRCQVMADNAGLGGTWRAVISNSSGVENNAKDYAKITRSVCNMNGQIVATGKSDFWDGSLAAPLNYNENGAIINNTNRVGVHTGTRPDGLYPAGSQCSSCTGGPCKRSGYGNCSCNNWTTNAESGVGHVTGNMSATDGTAFWAWLTSSCGVGAVHWYCLEQP